MFLNDANLEEIKTIYLIFLMLTHTIILCIYNIYLILHTGIHIHIYI